MTEAKTASSPELTCRTRPRKLRCGSPRKLTTKVDTRVSFAGLGAGLLPTHRDRVSFLLVTPALRREGLKRTGRHGVQASGDQR